MTKQAQLFLDSNRGVYIPQHFAEMIDPAQWRYITAGDIAELKAGPESENYWHSWDIVLNNAETLDGGKLYHDGDLWIVWADAAQAEIDVMVEYEESHQDVGDNYSHICLACYPIQEIEIQTELDDITLDVIGACHRGNMVYVATDVSWDAMVDVAELAAAIKRESEQ